MTTKAFPTNDVMSVITGRLMGQIGGVYEVLNWMTGESAYTHQLPRISREACPVLLGLYPSLQQAIDEAEEVNQDNWESWRDKWFERYGRTIAVPQFSTDNHERIDPLSELAEKIHPDRIVVMKPHRMITPAGVE